MDELLYGQHRTMQNALVALNALKVSQELETTMAYREKSLTVDRPG